MFAFCRLLFALSAAVLACGPVHALEPAQREFRAGAFAIDVSPLEFPVIVNGGMTERTADGVQDRLHARCLVLDDGREQIAIVIVDSCMMPRSLLDEAKQLASKTTGIRPDRMLIAATHTHSAPSSMGCLGSDADLKYVAFLPVQIAKGIAEAHKRLQPARIGWAVGRDDKNVANRHWIMKPGIAPTNPFSGMKNDTVMMHPGYENENKITEVGPVDPEVPVVSIQTKDGQPLALLTNYSLHYVGAPALSADYFAVVCDELTKMIGAESAPGFMAAHSNGTSGDMWLMNYRRPKRTFDRFSVAAEVAQAAHEAFQRIEYVDWAPIFMEESLLEVGVRMPSEQEVAEAREFVKTFEGRNPKTVPEVYARETLLLSEMPPTRELKLQAIRIGDLGIGTTPNETYASTGLHIKSHSPMKTTFVIELANGAEGYIPPPEIHALGGYTTWRARTACLVPEAERKIRAGVLELLGKVADQGAE